MTDIELLRYIQRTNPEMTMEQMIVSGFRISRRTI